MGRATIHVGMTPGTAHLQEVKRGSGCDARRLSTGRSIRAWRTLCGRQITRNAGPTPLLCQGVRAMVRQHHRELGRLDGGKAVALPVSHHCEPRRVFRMCGTLRRLPSVRNIPAKDGPTGLAGGFRRVLATVVAAGLAEPSHGPPLKGSAGGFATLRPLDVSTIAQHRLDMDQDLREPEITFAAGVIAKADWPHPHRERADTGKWPSPAVASKATRPPAGDGVPSRLPRLVPIVVYGETCPCRGRRALPRARTQERAGGVLRP